MARPPNDGNARRSTENTNGLFTTSSIKMIAIDDQPVSDAARKLSKISIPWFVRVTRVWIRRRAARRESFGRRGQEPAAFEDFDERPAAGPRRVGRAVVATVEKSVQVHGNPLRVSQIAIGALGEHHPANRRTVGLVPRFVAPLTSFPGCSVRAPCSE